MIERIVMSIIIVVAIWIGYSLFAWKHRVFVSNRITASMTPQLLYFGSANCAVCPAQIRYINQLSARWNQNINIQKIDVDLEPETAVKYQIMSLPTTMLLSKEGTIHSINYGLTSNQKLNAQIEKLGSIENEK